MNLSGSANLRWYGAIWKKYGSLIAATHRPEFLIGSLQPIKKLIGLQLI